MNNVLYSVGYNGHNILLTSIILVIIKTNLGSLLELPLRILYIILINEFSIDMNLVLKNIIKQPRPKGSKKINKHDEKNSKTYGMPSGHAQLVVNNLVYLSLLTKNNIIATISSFIALFTLYQRYIFRMHTISQLAYGSLLGGITGYIFYNLYLQIFELNKLTRHQSNL